MKKLMLLLVLVATASFAGVVEPFKQFTDADYKEYRRTDQNWQAAQLITLTVHADSDVWLSNYVSSWYDPKPLPALDGNVYDMSPLKYGWINKNDLSSLSLGKEEYESKIHWANGETNTITYYDDANPSITNSTTGYFLDHFAEDTEIYLVMTTLPEDGHETVDSYQYVKDADHDTTLVSRQDNTHDLAYNVRINFGIDSTAYGPIAREFVAVYDGPYDGKGGSGAAGGPLPSLLFVGLLSMGTVCGASRMKKRA